MTNEELKRILPYSTDLNRKRYLSYLNKYMDQYGINTPLRVSAFIAQIGHESGSLNYVCEIASGKKYEGRKDLGNTQSGDGVKFKGRGLIQITGHKNYEKISQALKIDFVTHPDLLEIDIYTVMSACWWWQSHGLNELADVGKFKEITRIINGGYNGLTDRMHIYMRAKQILKVSGT